MRDQFELGTTVPHEEPCAQLGQPNYSSFSKMEARAFVNQIIRTHGEPPEGTGIKIISCPHDFGTYYDLAIVYNTDDEESEGWMLKVEGDLPNNWDEEAIKELKKGGYPVGEYSGDLR